MTDLRIPCRRVDDAACIPSYMHEGDAGADLVSRVDAVLEPFERAIIPSGIAIAIPDGYAGLVVPRSGLAAKHGISIVNAPGLIDSGYRGEVGVVLVNLDAHESFEVKAGDRIAQLMIVKAEQARFEETDSLDITQRSVNGFGSSGV